jgi:hypothetical protein
MGKSRLSKDSAMRYRVRVSGDSALEGDGKGGRGGVGLKNEK